MLTGSIRTCRVSSVVNETIKTISSQFIFSRKDFEREKNANQPKPIKKNKQTKNKRTKKQQRQRFSARIKTSKRVEIVRFEFWCFLYARNLFVKKINWLEIVLIASFTVLLECLINRHL